MFHIIRTKPNKVKDNTVEIKKRQYSQKIQ